MLRQLLHVLYILRVQGWWEGGSVAIRSWSTCLYTAVSSQLTNVDHSCFTFSMSKQEQSALNADSITSKPTSLTSLCRVKGQVALRDCWVISQHAHVSIVQQHVSLQVKYYCYQVCIPLTCTLLTTHSHIAIEIKMCLAAAIDWRGTRTAAELLGHNICFQHHMAVMGSSTAKTMLTHIHYIQAKHVMQLDVPEFETLLAI